MLAATVPHSIGLAATLQKNQTARVDAAYVCEHAMCCRDVQCCIHEQVELVARFLARVVCGGSLFLYLTHTRTSTGNHLCVDIDWIQAFYLVWNVA